MSFLVSDTPDKKVYKNNADLPKTLKDSQLSKSYGVPIILKLEKVFTDDKKATKALGFTQWNPKKLTTAPGNDIKIIKKGMNYKTENGPVYALYTHKMTPSELKAEQDFIKKNTSWRSASPKKPSQRLVGKGPVYTDHKWKNFKYGYEVPKGVMKDQFDYLSDDMKDSGDFIQYQGRWYSSEDFMRIDPHAPDFMKGWDGYSSDSFFSGILLKYSRDGDQYMIGTYIS